jgi:UrcA family protein
MNTETQLARRSISRSNSIRVALVAMFALTCAGALADQPPAPVTRVAKVSLADLDLSTPEGARVAYERIKTTAKHLCSKPSDSPFWQTYDACVEEALGNAVRRLNTATVAVVQKSHPAP